MKKIIPLVTIMSVAVFNFTGCVAEKTTTQGGTLAPPTAKFLNPDELKILFTDKTADWKQLNNGKEGETFYHANGTFSMVGTGTWKIKEDGFKCNKFKEKEYCAQFSKKGNKYIGIDTSGNELFEFTVINNSNNQEVSISPTSGTYFSTKEVKQLFSGNTAVWSFLNEDKKGQTTYYNNERIGRLAGTWKITPDGLKCQTRADNNKEWCGKVYKEGGQYFLTNKTGKKAAASFTVK
jgi:hypothetical protein